MLREWGIVSRNTFDCPPIKRFVRHYLDRAKVSIDPFARNRDWCDYTNDLNTETKAQHHMHAIDFLKMLVKQKVKADLVIFDPPYSLEQVKRSYQNIGIDKIPYADTLNAIGWYKEKELVNKLLKVKGFFLHFGWHSNGMGMKRGYEIKEIKLVAHGRAVNDTICMAEQKLFHQMTLFN